MADSDKIDQAAQAAKDAVGKVQSAAGEVGEKLQSARERFESQFQRVEAEEKRIEQQVALHPALAVTIAVLCGIPVGVFLAWIPPLKSISKVILGIGG